MKRFALIACMFIGFAGCGSEGGDTLTAPQTEQAMMALTESSSQRLGGSLSIQAGQGLVAVDLQLDCMSGGTLTFSGSAMADATGSSLDLDFTFDACVHETTTLDGSLSYTGSLIYEGFQTTAEKVGEVTFSGDVEGTCVIDIRETFSLSPLAYTLDGTACGNTVDIDFSLAAS